MGSGILNHESDTGGWCDWPSVLHDAESQLLAVLKHLRSSVPTFETLLHRLPRPLTLSPNPHMRALTGCWTISKL